MTISGSGIEALRPLPTINAGASRLASGISDRDQATSHHGRSAKVSSGFASSLLAGFALACSSLVAPASAADFRLSNVDLDFGWVRLTAPVVDVRGSALDEGEFRRLIDPKDSQPATSRIARLAAQSITAQDITLTTNLLGQSATYSYEAVVMTGLDKGRIAAIASPRGSSRHVDGKNGTSEVRWTDMAAEGLYIAALNEALTTTRAAGSPPRFQTILDKYRVASTSQTQGNGITSSSGMAENRGLAMSAGITSLQTRFGGFFTWLSATLAAEKSGSPAPPPDLRAIADYISILEDVRFGTSETRDIVLTIKPGAKPGAKPDAKTAMPVDGIFRIARVRLADEGMGEPAGLTMDNMTAVSGPTKFSLGQFSATGFSGLAALAALRADLEAGRIGKDKAMPATGQLLRYIPRLGSVKLSGLALETPEPDAKPDAKGVVPLTSIAMKAMELTVREQENGIPSNLRFAVDGFKIPVANNDARMAALAQLGYSMVDAGVRIDLAWKGDRNEIAVAEIAIDGVGMANLGVSGLIGNATRDLFSGDMALAQVTALGATVKSLDLKLVNLGLVDRQMAEEARKAKKDPETLRREWGAMATLLLPAILGDSDSAKAISAAVSRFVASPKSLGIYVRARSAAGIGLADVIVSGDPKAILDKIDVKAAAE